MLTLPLSLRQAVRALRRTPVFAVAAIAIVATSVAAASLVFAIVDAAYFRPLPFAHPEALVLLEASGAPPGCQSTCPLPLSLKNVRRFADALSPIADIVYGHDTQAVFATDESTTIPDGAVVSSGFFQTLGMRPALGRLIVPTDSTVTGEPVVVLSHAFWQATFGGDSSVVGRIVRLNEQPHRVVGVLGEQSSLGSPLFAPSELTTPIFVSPNSPVAPIGVELGFTVLARLKLGISREAFDARANTVLAQLMAESRASKSPSAAASSRPRIVTLRAAYDRAHASVYRLFLAAVVALVCVSFTNLAALFLARISARSLETAVRAALGASRIQLIEQPLVEALVVCASGAAIGLLMANLALGLTGLLPATAIPYWTEITLDWRVVAFAVGVALIAAVLFGLMPAAIAARATPTSFLRASGVGVESTVARASARRLLLGFQIVVTVLLLSFAGLFAKAFVQAASVDIAMARHGVVFGALDLSDLTDTTVASQRGLAARLTARLNEIPGIVSAATSASIATRANTILARSTPGEPNDVDGPRPTVNAISAGYFAALGSRIMRGREFTRTELEDAGEAGHVAVVDEQTAAYLFPGQSAVGQRVKIGAAASAEPWRLIVGVVRSPRLAVLGAPPRFRPTIYVPIGGAASPVLRFTIRVHGRADAVFSDVRRAAHAVAPLAPFAGLTSVDALIGDQLAPLRTNSVIVGVFAAAALLLATLGVYGTVAYGIAQRRNEIAVRMALGAQRRDILRFAFVDVGRLIVGALAIGGLATLGTTRVARAFVGQVSPVDAPVLIAAMLLLVGCAVLAVLIPARRAALTDPASALRA